MMNAHHGKLPIPLPTITDDPRWIGRFSREVRKSIAALRDRRVIVSGGQRAAGGTVAPLQPYIKKIGEVWKIFVTPGFFGSLVPAFGADILTDDPPPAATLTEATSLWLVVEWEPASESDGDIHWIMPGGTLVSAVFEVSGEMPSETAAEVTEGGVITNGVYAILWASISESSGIFTLDTYRSENRQPGFCPPNNLEYPIG